MDPLLLPSSYLNLGSKLLPINSASEDCHLDYNPCHSSVIWAKKNVDGWMDGLNSIAPTSLF